ncbi:CAAX amino terminal protease self- immunity [Caulifigura coniformis]|uniref:CAAX amino terminal protease self-immunity n=1 Tax=Caulifigura coniformis TaxID=2527983 RepID=A0A517SBM8_9PLAN|nr:CPBP family intramembrane glutamic endopeptidase [Caulifigura coniformis]QDT53496.1 CAAX amino terminal protease self- immunity [Caulifigura coniformis]
MIDRRGLLRTAAFVYLALTALAVLIAWLVGLDLTSLLRPDPEEAAIGLAAVLPMSVVFFIAPDLKDRVVDLLGPALAQCRWYDLVALAAMAGISEELVFRGALEGWLRSYDILFAIVVANLLFGAMHPITVTYFLIAAGFGVYFSVLANLGPERNLTAPIVAHTVYDLIGFLLVARDFRKTSSGFVAPSRWPPAQTTTQPATTEPAIQDSADDETPADGTRPESKPPEY